MTTTGRHNRRGAVLVLASAFALASCGGSDTGTSDTAGTNTTLATSEASVTVTDQWARTSPMAATTGAAYMDIIASDGDELLSASVDASVAAKVEVHEVVMSGGSMSMQEVDKIVLPAGETVSLEPGGFHIMLLDLVAPLQSGSTIPVTLTFATAGEITIDVPVREEAP